VAKFDKIPGAGRFSNDKLMKVYRRGLGAYYSYGSRQIVCIWQGRRAQSRCRYFEGQEKRWLVVLLGNVRKAKIRQAV
jgi:hypothetical protein